MNPREYQQLDNERTTFGKFDYWGSLPTWIISNASMDNNHMPSKLWDEMTYTFPNKNGGNVNFVNE